jgi:uncharacterized protein
MTTQEEQMLQSLAERVNTTQLSEKDPEAEQFLQRTLGRNPDALYILAQTVLVQQYALDQAQKQLSDARFQLDQLRQQQQQPKPATSFLGGLLGHNEPSAPPPPPYAQPQFTPVPTSALPAYGAPQYGAPQSSSFLGTAMQTAAGVAAGALAFEGIESLMHGFGHSGSGFGGGGFGSGGFGGFGESNRPEEIVNNYYGDASPHEHAEHTDYLSPDTEERGGDSRFSDAVYNDDRGDSLSDKDDSSLSSDDLLTDSNDFDDSSGSDDTNF